MDKVIKITVEDQDFQRKLAIDDFLSCGGMKLFMEDLDDQIQFSDSEVSKFMKGPVTNDRLAAFNYNLGIKQGLQVVLNILGNFKDDLAERPALTASKK